MQARVELSVKCPDCSITMAQLPNNYYVTCHTKECSQFMLLYELPLLDLKLIGDMPGIDESTLIEPIVEPAQT